MATADLSHVQGFFATDAYPQGVAVNPVTHQVVAVRKDDAKVDHLSRPADAVKLAGPYQGTAAWSPNGEYLYLTTEKGVRVWRNTLSAEVQKVGTSWSSVMANVPAPQPVAVVRANEPLGEYGTFQVQDNRAAAEAAIQLAQSKGQHGKPTEWLQYEPYQSDPELRTAFREITPHTSATDAGLRIYRLNKLAPPQPHPGIEFLLGMSYYLSGQLDRSATHHLRAIHLDQARTNITAEALRCLGQISSRQDKPMAAAFCYAHVLRLDLDNPGWRTEAELMFKRANVLDAAKDLLAAAGTASGRSSVAAVAAGAGLPALPTLDGKTVYTAENLFRACAGSVVLIRVGEASGSGICIAGDGLVVTNQHVIDPIRDEIRVYTFQVIGNNVTRSEPLKAEVLWASEADDLALLRVLNSPPSLRPLPLVDALPAAGAKAYAIGHPGLGGTSLDQTITEGIVSAPARNVSGPTLVQHTAAVNPGNSGGALLDAHGCVVGIVTWKTGLEKISFAIPATRVRIIYESLRQTR